MCRPLIDHQQVSRIKYCFAREFNGKFLSVIVLQFVNPGDDSTMPRYQEWNDGLKSSIAAFASSHPEVSALYFSSHQTFSRILDEPRQHGFTEEQAEKKMGRGIWADHLHPTSEMHDFVAKDLTSFLASVVAE